MKRIIVIVVVIAILAVGGFFGYQQFLAPAEPTPEPEIDLSAVHGELEALEEKVVAAKERHNTYLEELGLERLP